MLPMTRGTTWMPLTFDAGFGRLRREMDSLFGQVFGEDGGAALPPAGRAPISIWEDAQAYHVEVDLPGVNESDIEVTVHEGVLHIKAERKFEEGRTYLYQGRSVGMCERTVTLPTGASADQIEATLTSGVLSVLVGKTPEATPKRITVQRS